jgi:hypothetical protein
MTLTGKGYYIWKVRDVERGDAHAILAAAQQAKLSHVLVKVADGDRSYNYDSDARLDLAKPVVQLLQNQGIHVWGWQYIYGDAPVSEARKAIQRTRELNLDGFVINAEVEFKANGMEVAARTYMRELRGGLPDTQLALSSFRFPSYHPQFPFDEFLEFCDLNMPQVYWLLAHNPDAQLRRTVGEFQMRRFVRPIVPTGSAYAYQDWKPSEAEIKEFMDSARAQRLNAANFWSWDYARRNLPNIWQAIANYDWPTVPLQKDITELYIDALNAHDAVKLATMYPPTGAHFYKNQALQGPADILKWYHTFFTQTFPNGVFQITNVSGAGNVRHFNWTGSTPDGRTITNGKDTIGVQDGKIAYHYKFFSVT